MDNNQQITPHQNHNQIDQNQQQLQHPITYNQGVIHSASQTSSYYQGIQQQTPMFSNYVQFPVQNYQMQGQQQQQYPIYYQQPQMCYSQNPYYPQQQINPQQQMIYPPYQQTQIQQPVYQQTEQPQQQIQTLPKSQLQESFQEQISDKQEEKQEEKVNQKISSYSSQVMQISTKKQENKQRKQDLENNIDQVEEKKKKIQSNKQFNFKYILSEVNEWLQRQKEIPYLEKKYFNSQENNQQEIELQLKNIFQLKSDDHIIPWKMTFQDENTKTAPTYNKPKILMKKFMQILSNYNLQKIHLLPSMTKQLQLLCQKCETSGTYKNAKNIVIRDAYTHAHFHAIFCRLNKSTITSFKKSKSKDRQFHENFFSLKLDEITNEQIDEVNFIKDMMYNIIRIHVYDVDTNQEYPSQLQFDESGQCDFPDTKDFRDYQYKVFYCIKQMHDGHVITKF